MQETNDASDECRARAQAAESLLQQQGFDTDSVEIGHWIWASCSMGFHPEDIAFHFLHMSNWAALRARLSAMFPGFAGLAPERLEQLRLLFIRGASEQEMVEEVDLILTVLGAHPAAPRP